MLKEIAEKQKKFFKPDIKDKRKLQAEIRNLKLELLINQLSFNKEKFFANHVEKGGFAPTASDLRYNEELKQKKKDFDRHIAKLQKLKQNKEEPFEHFDWKLDFPEVLNPYLVNGNAGFDIVIANPPYIGERGNKEKFAIVRESFLASFYQRKMDYFYFFFHNSLNLGKQDATITFITTNYYLTADGAFKLREDFNKRAKIIQLINFNEYKIFESAKGQHNLITILSKNTDLHNYCLSVLTKLKGGFDSGVLKSILSGNDKATEYQRVECSSLYDGTELYIRQSGTGSKSDTKSQILDAIRDNGERLDSFFNVSQGVLTGVDRISKKHIEANLTDEENVGSGVYVLTTDEIDRLRLTKKEFELVKPFYKNSDVQKYVVNETPKYNLVYATRDIEIEDYPKIKNHLFKFEEVIKNRSQERGEMQAALKQGKWWVIFAARDLKVFESEKIVCPQRSYTNEFGYTKEPWFGSADIYFIVSKTKEYSLKYLLPILNSKLIFFWLYNRGKRKGEMLEIFYTPLTELPVIQAKKEIQNLFSRVADYIIFLKTYNLKNIADQLIPTYFEQIIDGMVYELYFPDLIKKHKREIIQHLGELPEFTDKMSDEQKMNICKTVFNRLNDREHPVRVNLFYMSSIPEIAIIEGKNENN
ncbi:MAG: Eco57I restriction-modification methylase domain-containing protein [Flavobacterium sp.]